MDQKSIRVQAVRDAKCNLILDSARNVFSDKGFKESRLEDIASAAGFSKASLYNYFTDKEQIFLSLAVRDFDELLCKLKLGMIGNSGTLFSSIEYLYRTVFGFFGEHFAFFWEAANFQSECTAEMEELHGSHHRELAKNFQSYYSELLSMFAQVLRSARDRGEIKSLIPEITLAHFIAALVQGTVFEWKMNRKMGDIEKTIQDLLGFTANGLGCIEQRNISG